MIALKLLLPQKVSKGMGPQWQWAIRCKQNRFCCRFYNFFLNTTQWIFVYRLSNNTANSNKISFANSGGKALWAQSWKYQSKLYGKDWAANNFEQICKLIFECSMNSVAVFFSIKSDNFLWLKMKSINLLGSRFGCHLT